MATTFDTSYVNKYTDRVRYHAQQNGSKLIDYVRNERQDSESAFYEALDPVFLRQRLQVGAGLDRHRAPVIDDPAHFRWQLVMTDWEWDAVIDDQDQVRARAQFTGPYARVGGMAAGRQYDHIIVRAVFGSAFLQEDNSSAVTYTWDAWLAGSGSGRAGTAHVDHLIGGVVADRDTNDATEGMTLEKLINAKMTLLGADLVDPGALCITMTEKQLGELLADPQLTSQDYMQVKALVDGDMDTALGFMFKIISTNARARALGGDLDNPAAVENIMLLEGGTATATRRCFAHAMNHVVLGKGIDIKVDVARDPSLGFQWRIHHKLTAGAIRLEDEGVVEIRCLES